MNKRCQRQEEAVLNGDADSKLLAPCTQRGNSLKQKCVTDIADSQTATSACRLSGTVDTIPGWMKGHSGKIFDLDTSCRREASHAITLRAKSVSQGKELCVSVENTE